MQDLHQCSRLLAQPACIASRLQPSFLQLEYSRVQQLDEHAHQHSLARRDESLLLCPVYHVIRYPVLHTAQQPGLVDVFLCSLQSAACA